MVVAKDLHGGNIGAPGRRKEGKDGVDCLSDKTTIHARSDNQRLAQVLPVSFIDRVGVIGEEMVNLLQ